MVEIRPADPSDAEAIRDTARASWHAAYDDLLGEEVVASTVDEWYDPTGLRDVMGHSDHVVRVSGNDVVGFAHLGPNPENGRVAELFRIYVRPERWGEGIGGRLLVAAGTGLEGFDRLALSVLAGNEVGIGFYEKRGFERVGEQIVELGDETYREYRYERSL
ncbi:GNAT family N-acetyltransferase [Halalkalicoccus subterraneus]|uniref:GNAT family N-acetyltransferase n=1 Tax=Halalkalicoccus subterraneus TaxID=2675002 RepID=UPI000EFCD8B5|nr:GNAT family N-acetyltransferase [Halalkalicoccus subterraneus]